MKLNLKERAIIEYNLLWKYDSYTNLLLKESIHSKIEFTQKEMEGISQHIGVDGNTYTEFSNILDLNAEADYIFTTEEILYLADKIMVLDLNHRLNSDGMSFYNKIEEIYTQLQAENGYTKVGPWQYINTDEVEILQ